MYEQSFDVRAVGADFVLVNYLRSNNLDHVMAYRREGIRVGVLDTEGVGGKTPVEFAALVAASGGAAAVDLYCVWGEAQKQALVGIGADPEFRIQVTGCPRYDYCAPPWKDALPLPAEPPGYVLINTNFPVINPRFSNGSDEEVENAVNAGFTREFAETYVRDARLAHAGVIALVETILVRWPNQRFILRPHPFESHECYRPLERHANFALRQEGTSLMWINHARALLQFKCSTAVEAAMLGKPALSPAWLDTQALHVPGPSSVSQLAPSPEALIQALDAVLCSPTLEDDRQTSQPLQSLYHHIDGHAAERVADVIVSALSQPFNPNAGPAPRLKSRAVLAARGLFGHAAATKLAGMLEPLTKLQRRREKLIDIEQVKSVVQRLQACSLQGTEVQVQAMELVNLQRPRLASRVSILLTAANS
jgi:surface carbohydrate biosynthesis protein